MLKITRSIIQLFEPNMIKMNLLWNESWQRTLSIPSLLDDGVLAG